MTVMNPQVDYDVSDEIIANFNGHHIVHGETNSGKPSTLVGYTLRVDAGDENNIVCHLYYTDITGIRAKAPSLPKLQYRVYKNHTITASFNFVNIADLRKQISKFHDVCCGQFDAVITNPLVSFQDVIAKLSVFDSVESFQVIGDSIVVLADVWLNPSIGYKKPLTASIGMDYNTGVTTVGISRMPCLNKQSEHKALFDFSKIVDAGYMQKISDGTTIVSAKPETNTLNITTVEINCLIGFNEQLAALVVRLMTHLAKLGAIPPETRCAGFNVPTTGLR